MFEFFFEFSECFSMVAKSTCTWKQFQDPALNFYIFSSLGISCGCGFYFLFVPTLLQAKKNTFPWEVDTKQLRSGTDLSRAIGVRQLTSPRRFHHGLEKNESHSRFSLFDFKSPLLFEKKRQNSSRRGSPRSE